MTLTPCWEKNEFDLCIFYYFGYYKALGHSSVLVCNIFSTVSANIFIGAEENI